MERERLCTDGSGLCALAYSYQKKQTQHEENHIEHLKSLAPLVQYTGRFANFDAKIAEHCAETATESNRRNELYISLDVAKEGQSPGREEFIQADLITACISSLHSLKLDCGVLLFLLIRLSFFQ